MSEIIQKLIDGFEAKTGEKINRNSIHCHLHSTHKVLTLWEPWATLLVYGIKKNETRPKATSWTTNNNFISGEKGHYLIHSACKWSKMQEKIALSEPFRSALIKLGFIHYDRDFPKGGFSFPLGCIIGAVDFEKCSKIIGGENPHYFDGYHKDLTHKITFIQHPEVEYGDYTNGRYVWIGRNHRALAEPIPYKNGQGYYLDYKGDKSLLLFK